MATAARPAASAMSTIWSTGCWPGPVNLGNPNELTVADLVRRVVALTGTGGAIAHHPLPIDDPRRRRPDIGKAERLLGWQPRIGLQQGLERTIAWFAGDSAGARADAKAPAIAVAAE